MRQLLRKANASTFALGEKAAAMNNTFAQLLSSSDFESFVGAQLGFVYTVFSDRMEGLDLERPELGRVTIRKQADNFDTKAALMRILCDGLSTEQKGRRVYLR